MTDPKYAAFTALDPFFDIVQQGLTSLVDGGHYFDTIADDAEFEFRYHFPGDRIGLVGKCKELTLPASVCSLLPAARISYVANGFSHRGPIA